MKTVVFIVSILSSTVSLFFSSIFITGNAFFFSQYERVAMKNMKDQQKYSLVTNEERKKHRYVLFAYNSLCRQRIEGETKRKYFIHFFRLTQ
jgi:hypothetical protein